MTEPTSMRVSLSKGDAGVAETIAAMAGVVKASRGDELIAVLSAELRELADEDGVTYPEAVFRLLARAVVFKPDPVGEEKLSTPRQMVEAIAAGRAFVDCDELAMLGAALLQEADLPWGFVTIGSTSGGRWRHVAFATQRYDGSAWPLDPQEADRPGDLPASARRVRYWWPVAKT